MIQNYQFIIHLVVRGEIRLKNLVQFCSSFKGSYFIFGLYGVLTCKTHLSVNLFFFCYIIIDQKYLFVFLKKQIFSLTRCHFQMTDWGPDKQKRRSSQSKRNTSDGLLPFLYMLQLEVIRRPYPQSAAVSTQQISIKSTCEREFILGKRCGSMYVR